MSMRRLLALTMKITPACYTATTEYAGADGRWVTTATVRATRGK